MTLWGDSFAVLVDDSDSGEPIGPLAEPIYGPAEMHEGLVEAHVQPLYFVLPFGARDATVS